MWKDYSTIRDIYDFGSADIADIIQPMKNGMTQKRLIVICLSIIGFSVAVALFVIWYNQAVASRAGNAVKQAASSTSQTQTATPVAPIPTPAATPSESPISAAAKAAVINSYNEKYAYPIMGKSFCPLMNSGEYVQDLSELNEVTYLPEQEALHQYLAFANETCIDGNFSLHEYTEIIELYEHVANSEGNILRWHNFLGFVDEMYNYLNSVFESCASVNELTVEKFSKQLAATIAMYSGPNIGIDLPDIFSAQKLQCENQ